MAMKFDFRAIIDKILQNSGNRQPPKGCIIWQKAKTSSPVGKQYARMRNPFPGRPVVTTAHRVEIYLDAEILCTSTSDAAP